MFPSEKRDEPKKLTDLGWFLMRANPSANSLSMREILFFAASSISSIVKGVIGRSAAGTLSTGLFGLSSSGLWMSSGLERSFFMDMHKYIMRKYARPYIEIRLLPQNPQA